MDASVALHPAENPRNRSLEARRAARRVRFEREGLIVDSLNRGLSVVEIAQRLGVTEKRMRALVKEILARRMPAAPEDYAALQASRLNEALLVAYGAMSPGNLKAVALVVRIVRELDRYHGFVAAGRPETAPQALEKMESAPDKSALPHAFEAAPPAAEPARSLRADDLEAGPPNDALPPAAEPPQCDPAPTASGTGAETAPQAVENIGSAPGNGRIPAAAGPGGERSPRADGFAPGATTPEQARPPANPIERRRWNGRNPRLWFWPPIPPLRGASGG